MFAHYLSALAALASAVGLATAVVLFAAAVIRGLGAKADLITPVAFRRARLVENPPPGTFAPDIAWPWYFASQVRADVKKVRGETYGFYRKLWTWPRATFFEQHGPHLLWWAVFPVPLAVFSFLITLGAGMLACFALFVAVVACCWLTALVGFGVGFVVLRGVDATWTRMRDADASCPRCYHVSPRPAYKCPGCSTLHRDIRPGRLGVVARRCACGALMPTTVVRAAWRLTAVCQRCEEPLRQGAAAVRDIRIPIFGDVSAGKTRFLYSALDSMMATGAQSDLEITFPDGESHEQAKLALELIRSSREIPKTSEELPRAFSLRIGSGATSTLVHLFDAAGERYRNASSHDDMGFLETAHGLVYVLDPFAIGPVRDRLTGHSAAALRLAHAATRDPESAYGEVVSRLRGGGVRPESQRLAVVVSKVDILADCGMEYPTESKQISQWLFDSGLHNLVLAASAEFADVRYFAVASQATGETTPFTDSGSPLRWLLRGRGVRLPPEPSALTAGEVTT